MFGIFSNIKDGIELIGEAIGEEFLDDVKAVADEFREWLDENKVPIVRRVKNFVKSMKMFKDGVVELTEKNEVFAFGIKALAGAMVLLFARAHPVLAVLFATAAVIDDINNAMRGNKSVSGDFFKAYEEGGMGAVLSLAKKKTGDNINNSQFFKNRAMVAQRMLDQPANMANLRAEAAIMVSRANAQIGVGAMLDSRPFAPNQSLAMGNTNQSNVFNQTNNVSGDFAGQSVIDSGNDLKNMGQIFRPRTGN
jgi:hypothetical protein